MHFDFKIIRKFLSEGPQILKIIHVRSYQCTSICQRMLVELFVFCRFLCIQVQCILSVITHYINTMNENRLKRLKYKRD